MFLTAIENEQERYMVERLFCQYKALLFQQANNILQDVYLAEDAVQQTFVRIIDNLHRIDENNCPRTKNFLVIICENIAKDIYRKRSYLNNKSTVIDEIDDEQYGEYSNPLDFVVNNDTCERLEKMVNDLKPIYRDVFHLKIYQECSYEEIARLLQISVETVRKRLYRGRIELAITLEKEGLK